MINVGVCFPAHVLKHLIVQGLSAVDYGSTIHNRRKTQVVFSFIMYTPPFLTHSLSLSLKDLCGAHRQESLILRLGRPYTLLHHILHAYIETVEAQGKNCGFNMKHIGDSTL